MSSMDIGAAILHRALELVVLGTTVIVLAIVAAVIWRKLCAIRS